MMRLTVVLAAVAGFLAPAPVPAAAGVEASVVRMAVTYQRWDPDRPWAKTQPKTREPSAVIIEGPHLLTTAQMIADATFIQLMKHGRATRATARPVLVDREVDLALLEVESAGFFDDMQPVRLARETPGGGDLQTMRWKGRQFETAASRVKRFEVQNGYFGSVEHVFLLVQTDLSGGGWSEPVFDARGRLAGITASQKDQRARVIPVEIIADFLERAAQPGDPVGGGPAGNPADEPANRPQTVPASPLRDFPVFGARWQVNKNPALATYLGQTTEPRGVLIRQIPWGSSACGVLEPRDILLSVDGKAVDAGGFYTHPRLGQLLFTHILGDGHRVGDVLPLRVIREGREIDREMTLRGYPASLTLIPGRRGDEPPPYVVAGGLVFRELDGDYLRSWGDKWPTRAPLHLVGRYYQKRHTQQPGRRRLVLVTSVLPSPYNVGYHDVSDSVVETINGRPIDAIPDVVEAFEHPVGGFHIIRFEPIALPREVVLDAAGLEAATAEILEHYRVPQASRMPSSAPPDGGRECPGDY
jgi:S1-C subfamily serine protease